MVGFMKVKTRSYPLDTISAEKGRKVLCISRFRESFMVRVYDNKDMYHFTAAHEFTFEQLCALFEQLRPGITDILTP